MKKILIVVSAMLLALGAFGVASAATISFAPLDDVQPLGATFSITLVGLGFDVGTNGSASGGSGGGGVDISWDPTILTLDSVSDIFPGDSFFGSPGAIDDAAGTLTGFSVSSISGTALTDFDIATLSFTAIGEGLSTSAITVDAIDVWTDFDGLVDMTPDTVSGTVEVGAPVPIPGSILLLGSGLVGLVGLVRRKRS